MTEQDNIRDLFSKGLENQTTPVRPEIWNGLQAKMAAAGIASGSAAAAKGISVLTKWIIGGAAATAIAVTTVMLTNDSKEADKKDKQVIAAPSAGTEKNEQFADNTLSESDTDMPGGNKVVPEALVNNQQPKTGSEVYFPADRSVPLQVEQDPEIKEKAPAYENPVVKTQVQKPVVEPAGQDAVTPGPEKAPVKTEAKTSRSKIVKIPNVFTPNNDGDNDQFSVETKFVSDFSVTIMDQKGNPVFRSSDPDFKWDGRTMNGDEAQAGSYVCMIVAKGENNEFLKEYKVFELRK